MRKLRSLKSMIVNGFKGIWRNKGPGFLSTLTIIAVMLIVGVVLMVILNVNGLSNSFNKDINYIVAYLYDETTEDETNLILKNLSEKSEIEKITYVSKEQAIEDAKRMFSGSSYMLEGLGVNPYPASIIIELKDLGKANSIVDELKKNERIEKINYHRDLIEWSISINKVTKIGGLIAFVVIILLSVFIIANTIKAAISSRKNEVQIMKYVGASKAYIAMPFVMEGIFYSLLGSMISLGLLFVLYEKFTEMYQASIIRYISYNIININDIIFDIGIIYGCLGIGIGAIGSIMSIRKYLKV